MRLRGESLLEISFGTNINIPVKYFPLFIGFGLNNINSALSNTKSYNTLYFIENTRMNNLDLNISKPLLSFSMVTYKKYSDYTFGLSSLYAQNISPQKKYDLEYKYSSDYPAESINTSQIIHYDINQKLYTANITISREIKNYTITSSTIFCNIDHKYNLNELGGIGYKPSVHYVINERVLNTGITFSHNFRYITPYLSIQKNIYSKINIERKEDFLMIDGCSHKKQGIIARTGILISTSDFEKILNIINTIPFIKNSLKDYYSVYFK